MKIFDNLSGFCEYIPRCLFCQKILSIYIVGWNRSELKTEKFSFSVRENKFSSTVKKNNHKLIVIDLISNEIIAGHLDFSQLYSQCLYKRCKTCPFLITSNIKIINSKIKVVLNSESLRFWLKSNKYFFANYYKNMPAASDFSLFYINSKDAIKIPMTIDLSELASIKHLYKKINTALILL